MAEELKPCPFCGGKAFFANRYAIGKICRTVVCEDCRAVVTNFEGEDKEKAAEMWNSRSLDMIPCSKEMPESNTCYDNTAYIKGLSAIMAGKELEGENV